MNSSELPNGLGGCTTELYGVSDPMGRLGRAGGEGRKKVGQSRQVSLQSLREVSLDTWAALGRHFRSLGAPLPGLLPSSQISRLPLRAKPVSSCLQAQ